MGMVSVMAGRSGDVLVDELVGSAYQQVRLVAQQIEYIKHVSAHLAQIYRVHGSIAEIDTMAANLQTLYVPVASGAPSDTPTPVAGKVPMRIDPAGSKIWVYVGGAWKSASLV